MSGRRKKEPDFSIEGGEINLVPYLDIMVNLIMFMLLTFQVVAELKVINFNPPASGVGAGTPDPTKEALLLTVMITSKGHVILTSNDGAGTQTVPKGAADYDYAKLSEDLQKLQEMPNLNVDPENLVVVAEPDITYDKVVATLDAARSKKDGTDLFPKVTLGMAVGTQ